MVVLVTICHYGANFMSKYRFAVLFIVNNCHLATLLASSIVFYDNFRVDIDILSVNICLFTIFYSVILCLHTTLQAILSAFVCHLCIHDSESSISEAFSNH